MIFQTGYLLHCWRSGMWIVAEVLQTWAVATAADPGVFCGGGGGGRVVVQKMIMLARTVMSGKPEVHYSRSLKL